MTDIVWLASYPRSGNTFVRLLLHSCLGLRSASLYANDLGGIKPLEQVVGHIEHAGPALITFAKGEPKLVKTHEVCGDQRRAIYIVRDGRAAAVSLWQFLGGTVSLGDVVEGKTLFGSWQAHVASWSPLTRPDTLCLKYEEVKAEPLAAVEALSSFLGRPIVSRTIPSRESLSALDGKWVTSGSDWRECMTVALEERFVELNGDQLAAHGYVPARDTRRKPQPIS